MKLVRFDKDGAVSTGVVVDDGVIDLAKTGAPETDVLAIIAGGDEALTAIRSAIVGIAPHYKLTEVKLLAPYRPLKFLAIGMNYTKHAEEARKLGVVVPEKQFWFNKQTSCVSGPFDEIDPGVTEQLDYEVELGVIIGRPAKAVSAADALSHVFGYVVVDDVSARDWQRHSPTFTVGKSFDTHGPFGPWIVTADEIPDPHVLGLRTWVNGELRQDSNTSDLIHNINTQIEYLSTAFTLESGDLLATGTPSGVGVALDPPVFLKAGDVVRCEIDGIGAIENRVKG
ncbi:fumarylacetoacetate hydrolase family protein [Sphingobium sp. H39-3-25]|jgi:2-keto-4-pentenoate hydratase/2-oxohepta-3-ene-1,7-dioic acid hydratase in catechol pathway|uniref:fumarylacetoacetate hydrolase family protein n=1 Tax=Sphingomonadales TaxID=204457 RepID=UPI00082DEC7D|nr:MULTISPECIES: fumarylacetoacetate hydrolase family protein [Sphingomonadaceae]MDF0488865.1 fumarylacetoacetate hydrolase family protein [Sphingomonas pollutisoli]MDF0546670.1 fumarylacetoacetate hydrolase family protein [Sphingobium arseniciresistens]